MGEIETEVVVVGAGIAGLTAARTLAGEGRDVLVLEARDRVGGRTENVEIGGQPNEIGGQWVAPYQDFLRGLLEELGIELFPSHRSGRHVYVGPDGTVSRYEGHDAPLPDAAGRSYADAVAKLDALAASLDPEAPWEHPDAAALDAVTYEDIKKQFTGTPVDAFFDRIAHPAMLDVEIDFGSMAVSEVFPRRLPDLFVGRPRAQRDPDPEALLVVERNQASEPLARFRLHRLLHFRQTIGAHLGGPAGRQRILDRVEHVQPRSKRLRHPPGKEHRAIERLVGRTMEQDVSHRSVRHRTS